MSSSSASPASHISAPVCVIIAAYNAAATLRKAIGSALAQQSAGQVIVVDDASTDDTVQIARSADDGTGRLHVIALPKNMGPAAARNVALDDTRLSFVCVLDSDDFMLPGRLDRLVAVAETGWDIVADDILLCREGSDEITGSLFDQSARAPDEIGLVDFVMSNLSDPSAPRRELGYLKPLIRRSFLLQHQLRYDPTLRLGEDFILYANALASGARFKLITEGGYVAVVRPDSLSHRHRTADLRALLIADRTLYRVPGLARAERIAIRHHLRDVQSKYYLRKLLDIKDSHWLLRKVARSARRLLRSGGTSEPIGSLL